MADQNPDGLAAIAASGIDNAADLDTIWDESATALKSMTLAEKAKVVAANLAAGTVANTALTTNPLARANHTGTQVMATISDAGALATKSAVASADITDGTVANADLANMAQSTIKGRTTGAGTGVPVDLSATNVRTIIDTNTTPSTQAIGDSAAVGTADTLARGDHKHQFPVAADIYALPTTLNSQSASYTAVLADAGKVVEVSNASANTFTIPPNSSVAFPIGTLINVVQTGAGITPITPGAAVTIRCRLTTAMKGQWAAAQLYKRATDEWVLSGDLT